MSRGMGQPPPAPGKRAKPKGKSTFFSRFFKLLPLAAGLVGISGHDMLLIGMSMAGFEGSALFGGQSFLMGLVWGFIRRPKRKKPKPPRRGRTSALLALVLIGASGILAIAGTAFADDGGIPEFGIPGENNEAVFVASSVAGAAGFSAGVGVGSRGGGGTSAPPARRRRDPDDDDDLRDDDHEDERDEETTAQLVAVSVVVKEVTEGTLSIEEGTP